MPDTPGYYDGRAITYQTPDGRQLTPEQLAGLGTVGALSGGIDLGGNKQIDADKLIGDMEADYRSATEGTGKYGIQDAPEDPRNERFGDDLDWLDPSFTQKNPTREEALSLGTTGDEIARNAQAAAMDELFGIYKQGGNTAQDRAARSRARGESEDWLRGQREADMQNLAERGMSGSGAELATLLGDRQNAATRLSSADQTASADAEKRALDALMGGAGIGKDIQGAADDYVQGNQKLIADIENTNVEGRRSAYQNSQNNRLTYDINDINQKVGAAQTKSKQQQMDNVAGFGQAKDVGMQDAAATTNAQTNYNTEKMGAFTGYTPAVNAMGQQKIGMAGANAESGGQGGDALGSAIASYFSSGATKAAEGKDKKAEV